MGWDQMPPLHMAGNEPKCRIINLIAKMTYLLATDAVGLHPVVDGTSKSPDWTGAFEISENMVETL